jgi:hypothetical protein
MDSLLSFPVGLFHPLQHAGLSRRSPSCRPSGSWPRGDESPAWQGKFCGLEFADASIKETLISLGP